MTEAPILLPDPSARFEAAFRAVHARTMRGLAFVNPTLRVEAVGFAPWKAHWLGVMVTPWSMNLVIAPRDLAQWRSLPAGEKRRYAFPAGDFDFIGARAEAIGAYLACSLFSPMLEFADHATACDTARFAREALFDAAHAQSPAEPPVAHADAEASGGGLSERIDAIANARISRRALVHGDF